LEGLFAAGEDASGVHGANRLGGNGVAESTVYGARVGDSVAGWVKNRKLQEFGQAQADQVAATIAAADKFLNRPSGADPWKLRDELGKLMWEQVGIVRNGAKLRQALAEIPGLVARATELAAPGGRKFNLTWQQALDLRNLLTASGLIARSALAREDSRGAHYREDFPNTDNSNWLKNIYVVRQADDVNFWTEPVKLTRLQP
jgi:succinate dehydrogenase / fumarate reductase flavoprotein subunit/fumarate reductase flavoprotein subunit